VRQHHIWKEDHDIVALYLYKFRRNGISLSLQEIGERLGMGVNSLKMRIANFKAIAGDGGLNHYSAQSKRIYNNYGGIPEDTLRSKVLEILS
jgi:hypothetical protein